MKSVDVLALLRDDAAAAAVAQLIHYSHKIEQRRRGVLCGDADAEAQDWAEFRAALAKFEVMAYYMAELVDAAKAALVHVSCVGFPVNAEGGYDKDGAEWNFSDACPNPEDAYELKRARMVLAAALAKFGGAA